MRVYPMLDLGAVVFVPFMLFVKYPAVRQAEFPTPLVITPEAYERIPVVLSILMPLHRWARGRFFVQADGVNVRQHLLHALQNRPLPYRVAARGVLILYPRPSVFYRVTGGYRLCPDLHGIHFSRIYADPPER